MSRMHPTGQTIKDIYTDWHGRVLSKEEVDVFHAGMPRCRHCGAVTNHPGTPRQDMQTDAELWEMLKRTTHVRTYGGLVPVECWLEHGKAFRGYVRYARRGSKLYEEPYPNEMIRTGSFGDIYGIWSLVERDNAI